LNKTNIVRVILPIVVLLTLIFFFAQGNSKMLRLGDAPKDFTYSQFLAAINSNNVLDGNFDKDTFQGHTTKGNQAFTVYLPPDIPQQREYLAEQLQRNGVKNFSFQRPLISDNLMAIVATVVAPLVLIFVFYMFFLRQAQNGGSQALSFGRSKATKMSRK
jgi:cell division protease FtsH